jgi:HAD superfamily hydrolase (TIGR01484 family)
MDYPALACDYDGTLATHGQVDAPTRDALQRLRRSGRKLILVTGRELEELQGICDCLGLFDLVVVENGGLLYEPASSRLQALASPPPEQLVAALRARGVDRLSVGRTLIATWKLYEQTVRAVLEEQGPDHQLILNKDAVMILPVGIDKATGLKAALGQLGLSAKEVAGVGDAENDLAFLAVCGYRVAVANALPVIQDQADWVTRSDRGRGVAELIDRMIAGTLSHGPERSS